MQQKLDLKNKIHIKTNLTKNNKKMSKFEKLRNYEGRVVSFEYSGPDHPNGKVGPQKVRGKILNVNINDFDIETKKEGFIKLTINDIEKNSIKLN